MDIADHSHQVTILTEVERRAVVDAVASAITDAIGPFIRETSKLVCWSVVPGRVEVALLKANCGTVVMPFDKSVDIRPYFGGISLAAFSNDGKAIKAGRSTNLANKAFPSLWWDRDLLYVRPLTKWELERTIQLIKDKADGRPMTDELPPPDDVSLASLGLNGPGSIGAGLMSTFRAVYHRDRGQCRMCGSRHRLHIDHIIPRAKEAATQPTTCGSFVNSVI